MTELEKLDAGFPFHFLDAEIANRKESAVINCKKFNAIDPFDYDTQLKILDKLLGSHGKHLNMQQGFHCDCGKNIHVGDDFLTNYNVTILLQLAQLSQRMFPTIVLSEVCQQRKFRRAMKPVFMVADVCYVFGNF